MRALAALLSRLPRPTVRGWGFLVTGAAMLVAMEVLQRREFSFVGLLVLALPVVAAIGVSLYSAPLTIERRFDPELAPAGSDVSVRLLVRNWGSLSSPEAAFFDRVSGPLEAAGRSRLPRMPGFRASIHDAPVPLSLGYRLEARHRGRHAVGPFVLLLSDPFALVVRRLAIGTTDTLTVTPSTTLLPRGAVRLATGAGADQVSRQLGGAGEQDVISRKYQTGDSMRRVNWPATARFGELMVRQDDQQSDQNSIVLLDTAAASFGLEAQHDGAPGTAHTFSAEFEWAVSMSASIGLHLLAEGFHVQLVTSADAVVDSALRTRGSGGSAQHPGPVSTRFEPNGGEEALLLHAAQLDLIDAWETDFRLALSRSDAVVGELPPVFAVVGQLGDASAQALASAARYSSGAVAIVVTEPLSPGVPAPRWATGLCELLEAGGWSAQCVGSDEAPAAAWGATGAERFVL
ncbi:DUF58 domain-containing protein [Subtercola sp. RTI3]|uniref:DUF58 domain-containing protein n=1 Tax=Subtercola sp. RTI3 TaxID=3048639 RepID=UPI002B228E42|nr:DUF58 domain-containing protein [Subtercola sp. RTI3]MEA9985563.1 DUF58 domain-containing protein [Subtercola sp. RTI3]